MSFGKDYRLVGEVTVTGEKYRAGTPFWSSLAHTNIICRIKRMVEHYAVIGEYAGKPLIYDCNKIIRWLTVRTNNCLKCYPYYVSEVGSGEEFDPCKHTPTTDQLRFMSEFFAKMKEIGLGWKEFQLYYGDYIDKYFLRNSESSARDWDEKEIFRWQPRAQGLFINCINPKDFVDILNEIAANRRRLHDLPAAE